MKLLTFDKEPILNLKFKHCPLTWMFCNRKANNRINELHERSLKLVSDDYETSFSYLFTKVGSFTVHHTNIQTRYLKCIK